MSPFSVNYEKNNNKIKVMHIECHVATVCGATSIGNQLSADIVRYCTSYIHTELL